MKKLSDKKVGKERPNAVKYRIWSLCRNKTALMGYEWLECGYSSCFFANTAEAGPMRPSEHAH